MDVDEYIFQKPQEDKSLTLGREFLLKFSASANRLAVEWRMVNRLARFTNDDGLDEPSFAALAENALNAGQTTPETLGQWLKGYGFGVVAMLPANNLLGDGQSGWAIQVEAGSFGLQHFGVFGLSGKPGEYRMFLVHDWQPIEHGDFSMKVDDLNGNGQPEIIVGNYLWCSGFCTGEAYRIFLYEWQPANSGFVNDAVHVPWFELDEMIHYMDYDNSFPWIFGSPDESGARTILAPIPLSDTCSPLNFNIVYAWNGWQYQWESEGYLPMDSLVSTQCQVAAALLRGGQEPELLPILSDALATWSADYEKSWGVAAKDYLRLKLGILQALNGRREEALENLQAVRDQPENPQFQMAGKLAEVFLSQYTTNESVMACEATIEYLNTALAAKITRGFNFNNYSTDDMEKLWGFYDRNWVYNGNAVCDLKAAFTQSIAVQQPQTHQALAGWLDSSEIPHAPIQVADLTGDGTEDWLLIGQFFQGNQWPVWAILRDGGKLRPIPVSSFYISDEQQQPINVTLSTLRPNPALLPVVFLTQNNSLLVFQFLRGESYGVNILQNTSWIKHLEINDTEQTWSASFSIPAKIWSFPIRVSADYQWDTYLQDYIPVQTQYSEQDQAIAEIESLLFIEGKFAQAAQSIQILLANGVIEPIDYYYAEEGYVDSTTFHTYLQYLLGLAYELQSDEPNAVRAYWQLWHDFPDSPYTQLARAKLR